MPTTREDKKSELLSDEDNQQVFHIMGPRCQVSFIMYKLI